MEFDVELELPQYAKPKYTLDTQSDYAVKGKRESALWLPITAHSVPMGVR